MLLTSNEILRFESKVDRRQPAECWPWTGYRNAKGYGRARAHGRNRPAAQVAWSIRNGVMFPAGKMACHTCDNPPCCNPAHIWVGSHDDNMADGVAKGRFKGAAKRCGIAYSGEAATCINGHPRTPENSYKTDRQFVCRVCRRVAKRANYNRRVGKVTAA